MKRLGKLSLISLLMLSLLCAFGYSQSKETGAIEGIVQTPEGEPLPGVEVSISSPALIGGTKAVITNQFGRFRFPALPVGTYEAEARLQGFNPQRKIDIRLSVQQTLTVTFVLTIGSLEETIEVIGEAPILDVKDSQLSTATMEKEFLMQLPSPRSLRRQITYAPSSVGERGATPYGASESLSSNFLIDGVKTNSPEAGEPEVALDYDSIEEMKMMGQGTNAEYDGFSGIVVSTITKSGGNEIQGLGTFWFQLPGFHTANWNNFRDDEGELYLYQADWERSYDFHFNLGGPFIQDKLWWYLSAKYVNFKVEVADYEFDTERGWDWRALGKITWQISPNNRLFGTFDYSRDRVDGLDAGPNTAPEAVGAEWSWQAFFNANFLHIFSDTTFLEAKIGGYRQVGKPDMDYNTPPRFDEGEEYLSDNFWEIWELERKRTQINAAVSHHVEDFLGTHDFKFGGEYENSYMMNYRGYPGDALYIDYFGDPFLKITYAPYLNQPTTKRTSLFLQDQWSVSDRLSINWGIRWNNWRGSTPEDGTIFKPKDGFAPRLGITFDLLGDNTTALKAHYGRYYHGVMGMWFGHWSYKGEYAEYEWNGADYELVFEEVWGDNPYQVDPDLKFPYLDNFVVGLERELGKDMIVGVSYVYRSHHNLISNVNLTGQWVPVSWTSPDTGETFTIYERLNPGENDRYITNPYEGQGSDIGAAFADIVPFTPSRKYQGIEFTFRKRFSNRWQLFAAYTYSKASGSDDNSWGEYEENRTSSLGSSVLFLNPNWAINSEGRLTRDHPHIFKLAGSVVLPFDITLGGFYQISSGPSYNRNFRVPEDIDPDAVGVFSGTLRFYGEEKGSFRYPTQHNLDLRLEKFFTFGDGMRLGILMDMFNVLNADTITSVEERIEPGRDPFGFARGITGAREFRFGIHFEF